MSGGSEGGSITSTKLAGVAFLVLFGVAGWRYLHPKTTFAVDGTGGTWDSAVLSSQATKRPGLVLFTADWCGACRSLKAGPLSDPAVQAAMYAGYTVTVVDLTNQGEAEGRRAERYGVRGIPALIKFDADGKEVDRTGYRSAADMLAWLTDQ